MIIKGEIMKKTRKIFIILIVVFCFAIISAQSYAYKNDQSKQNGISYASWWSGQYSSADSDTSLENLALTGATWISLIVTCYQTDANSTEMDCTFEKTPTTSDLVHVINKAHELGLKVMLKPHIDLLDDNWRGTIGNSFTDENQWTAWFASYQEFIENYANLATDNNVDQLCVGTELVGTTHRESNWRAIIQRVRDIYQGPILYASNHSGEEVSISFWDALDYIGIDGYYPLTNEYNPDISQLNEAWVPHIATLNTLYVNWNKPIIFTEIGYLSSDGTNIAPYDYNNNAAIDLQEQADCYLSFFQNIYNQPWFHGVFWWYWSFDPNTGGIENSDYTPYGKPAEKILELINNVGANAYKQGYNDSLINCGPPPTAKLITPDSNTSVSNPITYTWESVLISDYYRIWVNDSTGNKVGSWFSAEECGCANSEDNCFIAPLELLDSGNAEWWIQTWNPYGYGKWSEGNNFSVSD